MQEAGLQPELPAVDGPRHSAVETARRRIMKPDPKGFDRLWEMKRLDMMVEAFVHDNPKFHPLFDQQTLDTCDVRLASVGYI
jgi:hypothetical protein